MEFRQTILAGLATLIVGCSGPKGTDIQAQRVTGSDNVSYHITTRTARPYDQRKEDAYVVKFCVNNKDNCVPKAEALRMYEAELDLMEAKALREARLH